MRACPVRESVTLIDTPTLVSPPPATHHRLKGGTQPLRIFTISSTLPGSKKLNFTLCPLSRSTVAGPEPLFGVASYVASTLKRSSRQVAVELGAHRAEDSTMPKTRALFVTSSERLAAP